MARKNVCRALVLTLVLAVSAQAAPARPQSADNGSVFERIVAKISKAQRAIQSVFTPPKG